MIQKNYASQCVEHEKPIILCPKLFYAHQLFFYLLAKIKMKKGRKFFLKTSVVQNSFFQIHFGQ